MSDSPNPSREAPRVKGAALASVVKVFVASRASILLMIFALLVGAAAILATPREEEPQIVVPMADVLVQVPGATAQEVENLVATPLERMLWQIDGVEYVYSTAKRDSALVTVRFYVGEDREESLIKLYNAITMNQDQVPDVVQGWVVKPVEIDDVPIVNITLYSEALSDFELRRVAEEVFHRLAETRDVSKISISGGRSREVRVELSPERMTGYNVTPLEVREALRGADVSVTAGSYMADNTQVRMQSDSFLLSAGEVGDLVVGVFDGRPVYVRDVAEVIDGPEEPVSYSRIGFSTRLAREKGLDASMSHPAVTIALAKKKGTNAVTVAEEIIERAREIEAKVLPAGVLMEVTRNYGATAQAKVNDLLTSLGFAIVTVVALLALALGWREALIVALSVPVSFSLALGVNYLLGYTINRVTLFALILSLGLVVDDPITNVDNIQRHILMRRKDPFQATLDGVSEVLPPVIMSTLAIIVSFLPLFFITGMMGPYMAPMAANVPLTVSFSTLAALTIVPWMAYHLLRNRVAGPVPVASGEGGVGPADDAPAAPREGGGGAPRWIARTYEWLVSPFLTHRSMRWGLLFAILALLAGSVMLAALRFVPLKMLPFDNKNEFQIVLDLDEGAPLEKSDRMVRAFEDYLRGVPEVTNFVTFSGAPSPMDFNSMVRHYYLRESPHLADIRVNLADKSRRAMQSHAILLRLRDDLQAIADTHGARMKLVETPPGPPVLSTLVAEIYGAPYLSYADLLAGASQVEKLMFDEPGVVDVDVMAETDRRMLDYSLDKEKAAIHGVTSEEVAMTLAAAYGGEVPATVHEPDERQPLGVRLILPPERRVGPGELSRLMVKGDDGHLVPLAELGRFRFRPEDRPIYHKDLRRVVFVTGEMAGRAPAEAILDMQSRLKGNPLPPGVAVDWAGEGEWKITLDVFRDLGIAFAVALVGIYVLLVMQTNSFFLPLLQMAAIPLTLLGIMPGFWLLNLLLDRPVGGYADPVFFTATSMIGMIALGGIVIRNSVVLMDFIADALAEGKPLKRAILDSGAVRMRPIVLTALTTALGAWPITLDPIFSGLAWALIFGLVASTMFTLLVIPVTFYAVSRRKYETG